MATIVGTFVVVGIALVVLLVVSLIAYDEGKSDGRRAKKWGQSRYDNGYWMPWAYVYDLAYNYGRENEKADIKKKNQQRFNRD